MTQSHKLGPSCTVLLHRMFGCPGSKFRCTLSRELVLGCLQVLHAHKETLVSARQAVYWCPAAEAYPTDPLNHCLLLVPLQLHTIPFVFPFSYKVHAWFSYDCHSMRCSLPGHHKPILM
jgi:hypothetical protein